MEDESLFSDLVDVSVKCVRYKLKYDEIKSEINAIKSSIDSVNNLVTPVKEVFSPELTAKYEINKLKLKELKVEFDTYLVKQQNVLDKVKNHCDNNEQLCSLYLGTLDVINYLHAN